MILRDTILIADDEPLALSTFIEVFRNRIGRTLPGVDFNVLTANSGDEALAILESNHENLIAAVFDDRMGNGPLGREIATRAAELSVPSAVFSGTTYDIPDGEYEVFEKPTGRFDLMDWISGHLQGHQKASNRELLL